MVLDPSAYIAGLNRAAQHTAAFQSSIRPYTADQRIANFMGTYSSCFA